MSSQKSAAVLLAVLAAGWLSPPSTARAIVPPRQPGAEVAVEPAAADDEAETAENGDPGDGERRTLKRRPGAVQMDKPGKDDERLVDPEAARRAQFFGDMPAVAMPGFPMPGFPMPGFAGGAVMPQGNGVVGHAFQFSHGMGNAVGGGQGMVVEQWILGPDGWVRQPPAGVVAPDRPGARKQGAAGRAPAAAKKPAGRGDAGKRATPRSKRKAADADGE